MIYNTNIIEFILEHWIVSFIVVSLIWGLLNHLYRVYKFNSYKKQRRFKR